LFCCSCDLQFLIGGAGDIIVVQCDAGHLACSACDGLLCGNQCYACDGIGSYGREPALDNLLRSVRVPCPNDVYGCRAYVAYCEAGDGEHRRACPCAPCCCPERGCRFVGSPPMLADHIASKHSSPVVVVSYGEESSLVLTAARRWHALVGQEDRSLFVVSLAAPCSDDTAVSLVCVRANTGGGAAPRYTCRLTLELPSGGDDEEEGGVVVMEYGVRSSALPSGTPALDQRAFLGLHQQLKAGDTLALSVRIDRLQPIGATA
jgi:E3 ubiquitin-protein ligase SIAH1